MIEDRPVGTAPAWTPSVGIALPAVAAFAAERLGRSPREVRLEMTPLRGGLDSAGVARVTVRPAGGGTGGPLAAFVVKALEGPATREAEVYRQLLPHLGEDLAPGLLGAERLPDGRVHLYLELVRPMSRWPWRSSALAGMLLERLAGLHSAAAGAAAPPPWDFEAELARQACDAVALLAAVSRSEDPGGLRRGLPALRRLAEALPQARRQLLSFGSLGPAVLHGDVHTGNAMIRRRRGSERPVLLDWGRARQGSPLEDVASWLQSLGFWEPEARRRHDTLLGRYLAARGMSPSLGRGLRDAYWLAAGSNALAGALGVHLRCAAAAPPASRRREAALWAARDGLRVVRRADACWSLGRG